MRDNEKLNSSEQNEQNQTEAERVLGGMPSFEEHMQEIENEENNKDEKEDNDIPIGEAALDQDIADIETIKDVTQSRKRDALNEAVNERMDKLEIAAQNGEHISNADRLFMFKQEGPNSAREDIINAKAANYYNTAAYIEQEKGNTIANQAQIDSAKADIIRNLEENMRAGEKDPAVIKETMERIKALDELSDALPEVDKDIRQPRERTAEEVQKNQSEINDLKQDLNQEINDQRKFI